MVSDIVDNKFYYYFVGLRQQSKLLSSCTNMNLSIAIKQWYSYLKINKYCLKELEIQQILYVLETLQTHFLRYGTKLNK